MTTPDYYAEGRACAERVGDAAGLEELKGSVRFDAAYDAVLITAALEFGRRGRPNEAMLPYMDGVRSVIRDAQQRGAAKRGARGSFIVSGGTPGGVNFTVEYPNSLMTSVPAMSFDMLPQDVRYNAVRLRDRMVTCTRIDTVGPAREVPAGDDRLHAWNGAVRARVGRVSTPPRDQRPVAGPDPCQPWRGSGQHLRARAHCSGRCGRGGVGRW